MLKSYFVLAFRLLSRNRVHTLINLLGISVSVSACLLIYLYIQSELNYDKSWSSHEKVYRVTNTVYLNGMEDRFALGSFGLTPALKTEFPQLEAAVRLMPFGKPTVRYEDKIFNEEDLYFTDADVFQVFDYPFIYGDPKTALVKPHSIVLTKEMSEKYFGDVNPLGKSLKFPNESFTVTGVIKNDRETHIKLNAFLSISSLPPQATTVYVQDWFRVCAYNYIKFKDKSQAASFAPLLSAWSERVIGAWSKQAGAQARMEHFLQPVADAHFDAQWQYDISGTGNKTYLYIFACVGVFLLLISSINYMNLAIAASARRAKEVGVRKSAGATQTDLIIQFLGESALLIFAASLLALALTELLLPFFNELTQKDFHLLRIDGRALGFVGALFGILVFTAIAGGLYPALALARFRPSEVLRGLPSMGGGRAILRKTLVTVQFALSISVVFATMVVFAQMRFMKNKDLGFRQKSTLAVKFYGADSTLARKLPAFKEELRRFAPVKSISVGAHVPGNRTGRILMAVEQEGGKMVEKALNFTVVDADYFETLKIPLLKGRTFRKNTLIDTSGYIINEAAAQMLGWREPLDKKMTTGVGEGSPPGRVIGVVKDFHYASLHQNIEPLVFVLATEPRGFVILNLETEDPAQTLAQLSAKWKAFDPNHPMEYYFLDENFDKLYQKEERLLGVFAYFAALTIFISCLGLYGLASYTITRRTKEIGVRKVLGASEGQVIALLVKEFAVLVAIAALVATPPAYYLLSRWLEDFAFRVSLGWEPFLMAAVLALCVACLAVGVVAARAARQNPILSLRYE